MDRPLVAALEKLDAGLPRQLLPEKELNRLDFFLEELRTSGVATSKSFMIYCHDLRSALAIKLNDDLKQYISVNQPLIS